MKSKSTGYNEPQVSIIGHQPGVVIVMADENLEDQSKVKEAARSCMITHVFSSVYNGEQLMCLLLQKDAYFSEDEKPDLIILDLHLRLIDGFEALKQIKTHKGLRSIPVYILTKEKNDEEVKRAMDLGASDFFKKPIDYKDLLKMVKNICDLNFKNGKVIQKKDYNR